MTLWRRSKHQRRIEEFLSAFRCDYGKSCAARVLLQCRFEPRLQPCLSLLQCHTLIQAAQHLHPACAAIKKIVETWDGLRRHRSRNPKCWNLANVDALERRGSYSDDRPPMTLNQHLSANHIGSASELRLPEVVRKDSHRIRAWRTIRVVRQHTPQRRPDAEYRKVVTGDNFRRRRAVIAPG